MHTATWDEVVSAITGVKNRGSFSKTFTPTMSAQSQTGEAGYYSSVYVACNGAGLSGNAGASQVLSGYTFYSNSLTRQNGAMINVPNTSSVTLTAADGRKILNAREVWVIANSDGVRRVCFECPTTGYYTNTSIVACPTDNVGNALTQEYHDYGIIVPIQLVNHQLTTSYEYYAADFTVNSWANYNKPGIVFVCSVQGPSAFWGDGTQVEISTPELSENHLSEGWLRYRIGIRNVERTAAASCIVRVRLEAYRPII